MEWNGSRRRRASKVGTEGRGARAGGRGEGSGRRMRRQLRLDAEVRKSAKGKGEPKSSCSMYLPSSTFTRLRHVDVYDKC